MEVTDAKVRPHTVAVRLIRSQQAILYDRDRL